MRRCRWGFGRNEGDEEETDDSTSCWDSSDSQIGCSLHIREEEQRGAELSRTLDTVAPVNLTNHHWGGGALTLTLFIPSLKKKSSPQKQLAFKFLKTQPPPSCYAFSEYIEKENKLLLLNSQSSEQINNGSKQSFFPLPFLKKKKKKLTTKFRAAESWSACLNKQTFVKKS